MDLYHLNLLVSGLLVFVTLVNFTNFYFRISSYINVRVYVYLQ